MLVAAAAWSGLWFHLAGEFRAGIERWTEQRRAEGWAVAWRTLEIVGFPLVWKANITAPQTTRTGTAPHWFWRGPERLTLHYRPWSPRSFALAAPGRHIFGPDAGVAESTVTMDAGAAEGRLELGSDGRPRRLSLAIDGASARSGAITPVTVATIRASLAAPQPETPAVEPHRRPTARLDIELAGLRLPENTRPVLGHTVGRAALGATLLGRLPPAPLTESLAVWRDDGGTVEIERLALGWGPLSANGDGTLALDEALQPQAALSARISGYAETVDALVRAGTVRPEHAFVAKLALGALARTPEGGGPAEIAVPITIQDRQLFVGPVALIRLPRIEWPSR